MRKLLFLLLFAGCAVISAQSKMYIHKSDNITLGVPLSAVDSIFFNSSGSLLSVSAGGGTEQFPLSAVDSISFASNSDTVDIRYTGNSVIVNNPLAFENVKVSVNGAHVTITSKSAVKDLNYRITGTASDGMLKIYSDKRFNLFMNGVSLTNLTGPAVNLQSDSKASVTLVNGTSNNLTDGKSYADSVVNESGATEDQNAAFYSKGKLAFSGTGSLTINGTGNEKHALYSKDVIEFNSALLTIPSASKDGLHAKDGILIGSGTVNITSTGDAVLKVSGSGYNPSYSTAIKSDSSITVSGANVTIKSSGKGGKGLSSDKDINILSGSVNITTSGAGQTYKNSSGLTDCYNAACISADGNISILGGTVTVSSSGAAGKGITADGTLTIGDAVNSPVIGVTTSGTKITISGSGSNAEYAEAKAISCNGAVTVNNGSLNISSADDGIKSTSSVTINKGTVSITKSVEGIEAPYIYVNDGNVSIISSDDGFNATKGNGGEANDGSCLYLKGGNVSVNASGGDGLDSNGSMVISGGTIVVNGPQSAPEVGLDYNGTCNVSGGLLLISGPNSGNMIQANSTSSTQYSVKATTTSALTSSTFFHIQDASGIDVVTFKPVRNVYYVVFSSSALKNGSTYYVYTGGTSTGTNNNGLYTGGTYSGGTLKKSFTVSGAVTSVTF